MEMMTGIPPIRTGTAVQNRGVMDFLSEGDGVEEDRLRTRTWKMMMGYLGVSRDDEGPGVIQDPRVQKDLGDPPELMGPRGIPGGLSSTGLGDTVLQSPNVSTIAVENSLQYVGESLSRLMLTQHNVNRNMVDHLNLTAEAQDVQTHVLTLVKNTRQREFNNLSTQYQYTMERIRISLSRGLLRKCMYSRQKRCAGGSYLLMRGPCIRGHKEH